MTFLLDQHDVVGTWVAYKTGSRWISGMGTAIGVLKDGKIVGGITYTMWNGKNVWMDVAGEGRWISKTLLWMAFDYPFNQMNCSRVTGYVEEGNATSRGFLEHLGFSLETRLEDAGVSGDGLIYRMFRDECRFLRLNDGQEKHAAACS